MNLARCFLGLAASVFLFIVFHSTHNDIGLDTRLFQTRSKVLTVQNVKHPNHASVFNVTSKSTDDNQLVLFQKLQLFNVSFVDKEHIVRVANDKNTKVGIKHANRHDNSLKPKAIYRKFIKIKRKVIPSDLHLSVTSSNRLVLQPHLCQGRNLTLVICVSVARANFQIREDIRDTWGSYGVGRNSSVALAFLLGSPKATEDKSIQNRILKEFNFHKDIVQGSFIDDYKNLTLKSVFLVHWIAEYCRNTKYVLKADDDIFVNIPLLVHVLRNTSRRHRKPFIIGKCMENGKPLRLRWHKYYGPTNEFPGKVYPNYLNGGSGYAMTTSAAVTLRDATSSVNFFRLEDIFLTGIVANKSNIDIFNDDRFSFAWQEPNGLSFSNQITAGHYNGKNMRILFSEMNTFNVTANYSLD